MPSRHRAKAAHSHDPALELIYLQAGCEACRRGRAERTREALSRADFAVLVEELRARRLLPLIGGRLLEAAGGLCPPDFASQVNEARTAARARAMAVYAATMRTCAALAGEGIPALPLKGPLLAEAAHGDLGLRETADVDVLVSRNHLWPAARLLQSEGFEPPADHLDRHGLPDLHLALHHADRPSVELHWRVYWYETDFSREMLERAEAGADGLLRAQTEDLAASLLLFYARDGFHGVRLAADTAAWWDHRGHDLPAGHLDHLPARHPSLALSLTAAAAVVEEVTGTPTRAWLGGRPTGRRAAVAERLADWTQEGDRDQLAANISLAGGLLGPAGASREFLRRELRPQTGPTAPHAAKMVARYALALWRVRAGRRWIDLPTDRPTRIELCGMPLDLVTEEQVVARVIGALEQGSGGWIVTPNLEQLRLHTRSPALREIFEEADLVVADGMPLVWASRLAGSPLPARVAGSDLVWSLAAAAASAGRSVFLLGGDPGAAEAAAHVLRAAWPGLDIAGVHSPPKGFEARPEETEEIRSRLRSARPDIVYVGLGFPKQEQLIRTVRDELEGSWFVGVGISISFLAGHVPRAPKLLRRTGLEWAHRLAMEPRRLARRYLRDGPPFAVRLAVHALGARMRGGLPKATKR